MNSAYPKPEYGTHSDAGLLRAAASDPQAFSELYARHVKPVYVWLEHQLPWAAADLTAETFARAWLRRSRFRDDRNGSALPWLLAIARNLLYDVARHNRIETRARERLGLPLDLAAEDSYGEIEERLSPRIAVRREVASLPEHERRALLLRVVEELPYEQVASRLEIRPAAARLRVSRALRRLARAIPMEEP